MTLADGTYDALVVDASRVDDQFCTLELVVTLGPHKGDLVELKMAGVDVDPLLLLGLPGTIQVADGLPRFLLT